MSAEAPEILLAHHLKALKLPTFLREHQKLARQCATEGLDHVRFLARLVEMELIDRERRMVERRIKTAKFPAVKSLDSFDFAAIPRLNKMQVLELARGEWIERRENVIALGPSDLLHNAHPQPPYNVQDILAGSSDDGRRERCAGRRASKRRISRSDRRITQGAPTQS